MLRPSHFNSQELWHRLSPTGLGSELESWRRPRELIAAGTFVHGQARGSFSSPSEDDFELHAVLSYEGDNYYLLAPPEASAGQCKTIKLGTRLAHRLNVLDPAFAAREFPHAKRALDRRLRELEMESSGKRRKKAPALP